MTDPNEAYKPTSPHWGSSVSPAAKVVPQITSELERLREFAETFARCPCCEEIRECCPVCNYREDCSGAGCLDDYFRMQAARVALWGGDTCTLQQAVIERLREVHAAIARGHGEWPSSNYVPSSAWDGWLAQEDALRCVLRQAGIDPDEVTR
jgi:hypothetical protein